MIEPASILAPKVSVMCDFGPIPCFSCLDADYSNSRKKMSFLLPYGKLHATVKEKFK